MALDGAEGAGGGGGGADASGADAGGAQGPDPSSPGNTTGDDGDGGGPSKTDRATDGAGARDAMSSPEGGALTDAVADQVGGGDEDDDDNPDDGPSNGPSGGPQAGGTGAGGPGGTPGAGAQQAAADAADALAEDPAEQAAREQAEVIDAERAAHDRAQDARKAQALADELRGQGTPAPAEPAAPMTDAQLAETLERAGPIGGQPGAAAAQALMDELTAPQAGPPQAQTLAEMPEAQLHTVQAAAPAAGLAPELGPLIGAAARVASRVHPGVGLAVAGGAVVIDAMGEAYRASTARRAETADVLGLDQATRAGRQAIEAHDQHMGRPEFAQRQEPIGELTADQVRAVEAQGLAALELAEDRWVTEAGHPDFETSAQRDLAGRTREAVHGAIADDRIGAPPAGGGWAPGLVETVAETIGDGRAPHEWDGITPAQRLAWEGGPAVEGLPDQSDIARELGRLPGFGEGAPVVDGAEVEGLPDQHEEIEALTRPGGLEVQEPIDNGVLADPPVDPDLLGDGIVTMADPPPAGSLDNTAAREWYLAQEARIAERLDPSAPLADQARDAFELRNEARTLARRAMEDRALAESLDVTDPNLTWEQLVDKLGARGLEGDRLYEEIISSAQRSRRSVNQRLGLD